METKFFCLDLQVERRKSKCNYTENADWKLDKKVKLKKIRSIATKAKAFLSSESLFTKIWQHWRWFMLIVFKLATIHHQRRLNGKVYPQRWANENATGIMFRFVPFNCILLWLIHINNVQLPLDSFLPRCYNATSPYVNNCWDKGDSWKYTYFKSPLAANNATQEEGDSVPVHGIPNK